MIAEPSVDTPHRRGQTQTAKCTGESVLARLAAIDVNRRYIEARDGVLRSRASQVRSRSRNTRTRKRIHSGREDEEGGGREGRSERGGRHRDELGGQLTRRSAVRGMR